MSHYPTSAELRDFRRAILAALPVNEGDNGTHHPFDGGAWQGERIDGIGHDRKVFETRDDLGCYLVRALSSVLRVEAAAMRSRRFTRIFGTDMTWPEITTFAPEPRRYRCPLTTDTYHCINCGGVTCPEYACATYNPGEVAHIA